MIDPPPPRRCGGGEAERNNNIPPRAHPHGDGNTHNLWMRFWTAFGSGSQHQFRATICRRHGTRLPPSFIPMPGRTATLLLVKPRLASPTAPKAGTSRVLARAPTLARFGVFATELRRIGTR